MTRLKVALSLVFTLSASAAFCAPSDFAGSTAPLTIAQPTQIPGDILKPGDYSITVVDQLADRMIVRIDSKSSSRHSIFLAVPALTANQAGDPGPVFWQDGVQKTSTLRGFNFATGRKVEFVFPKAEAAALAKSNGAKVMAIDPQSEGRAALKSLSNDELQVVSLWMLSLTTTGTDSKTPAILAQKYEAKPEAPVVVAQTAMPAPAQATPPVQVASLEVPPAAPRPTRKKAVIAVLPHTAGQMPLVWMIGLLSVFGAFGVRFARQNA